MTWFRRKPAAVDEATQDRRALLMEQKRKLREAEAIAATLRRHDQVNHYSQRLRRAYALAEEGTS